MNFKSPISKRLPIHFKVQWRMMLVTMLSLLLMRVLFFITFFSKFQTFEIIDWLGGFFFDAMTVCIAFLPFSMIHLLPLPLHNNAIYRGFVRLYFILVQVAVLALNLIDLEYYKFTGKRSTFDLFDLMKEETGIVDVFLAFIKEFWWIILLFIFLIVVINLLYKKWILPIALEMKFNFLGQFMSLLLMAPIVLIIGRGGFQLRPMGIIEAARFSSPNGTALVLNTAFTVVKSYGDYGLETKNFFPEKEAYTLFDPRRKSEPQNIFTEKPNVVILILESFGKEWFAPLNTKLTESYTPFLDSLIKESWYFPNSFANGKKSIEAVPAILGSIPSLLVEPYISSQYGANQLQTLPLLLKKEGYSTAFYHAATNGSMRFDSYSKLAGFDGYFGRKEYNNEKDFDGTWGIVDHKFNPWVAKQMSKQKQPFLSTVFTISSHHPYYVPPAIMKYVVKGKEPIATSISYGDYALRKFFDQAKKENWYQNTIFVLCADHSPSPTDPDYFSSAEMYRIPIAIYSPNQKIAPKNDPRIFQQVDIFPTLLDLTNTNTKYYSIGHSAFNKDERFAVSYLEGVYYYFCKQFLIEFSNDQIRSVSDLSLGKTLTKKEIKRRKVELLPLEKNLKALIQLYNKDLIENRTVVK